jgi:hypothetical protein
MIALAINDRVKVVNYGSLFCGDIGYIADIRAGWLLVNLPGKMAIPFRFNELELFEVGQ